ncbi:MAG TPA: PAS domain S-box protein [Bacillales bacterium]|nr:PAS domain S-box protein [Bacillales bacterium]
MKQRDQREKRKPMKIATTYGLVGIIWVLLTDVWLNFLLADPKLYEMIEPIKGVFFVFLSGAAIYFSIKHFSGNDENKEDRSKESLEEFRLEDVVDHLKFSVSILDPNRPGHPITYVNREFTKLTGYSFEEVVGKNCSILQGEKTDPKDIEKCTEVLEGREPVTLEILNYRKDGTTFWNELAISPIFDSNGKLLFHICLQNDITQRKNAESKLKESEQYYRSLFYHNPALVCSSDKNGVITSVNPAVKEILGHDVSDVINMTCYDFIDESRWEEAGEFFEKSLEGHTQKGQIQLHHKDGHLVDLESLVMPIVVDGEIIGMYTVANDVTEYNKAQELLSKAEKLNIVGELAAGIAHEIRNPLTSLKGFVQLLRPSLNEKKAYTDVMLSELERIEQIVTELLLLAKPQTVQFEEKNLQDLLEHVCTLLNTKAIMSNIEISLDYQCEVTCIYCEENQLKQVLINLLKNAIEAMPEGGEIRMEADNPDDEHVKIFVIDQGCGIPEDNLPKLGEPFYTTKEQGTGLGLMISSKIIKEHGGNLQFKSGENEGTTAEILLPISPKAPKKASTKYQITG